MDSFPSWFPINSECWEGSPPSLVFVPQAFLLWHCCYEHRLPSHSAVWIIVSVPSSGDRCLCGCRAKDKIKDKMLNLLFSASAYFQCAFVKTWSIQLLAKGICVYGFSLSQVLYIPSLFFLVCPVVGISVSRKHIAPQGLSDWTQNSSHTLWFGLSHRTVAMAEMDMKILGTLSSSSEDMCLSFEVILLLWTCLE